MEFEGRTRTRVRLDVAPLVDVVFLLLLFFLLTSTYVARNAIAVRLPEATSAEPAPARVLTITLEADGDLWLDGAPIARDALPDAIAERLQTADPPDQAIVEADAQADVAALVDVVDVLRAAGADSVAIRTHTRKERP